MSNGTNDDELLLHGARLEGEDFSGRRLRYVSIANGAHLVRCDFSRVRIKGGGLGGGLVPSEYVECRFDGSRLSKVLPGRATFIGCSFRDVRIDDLRCLEAQFIDCVFTGLLRTVTFDAVPTQPDAALGRTRNEYRGNDLSGATLEDVAFRGGIDLALQRLPTGPDYVIVRDAPSRLSAVRDQVRLWPKDLRQRAETTLSVLESECRTGQRDLFLNRSLLGRTPEARAGLAALLDL